MNFSAVFLHSQALEVSDHYPVEVELRKASPFWMAHTPEASVIKADTSKE